MHTYYYQFYCELLIRCIHPPQFSQRTKKCLFNSFWPNLLSSKWNWSENLKIDEYSEWKSFFSGPTWFRSIFWTKIKYSSAASTQNQKHIILALISAKWESHKCVWRARACVCVSVLSCRMTPVAAALIIIITINISTYEYVLRVHITFQLLSQEHLNWRGT